MLPLVLFPAKTCERSNIDCMGISSKQRAEQAAINCFSHLILILFRQPHYLHIAALTVSVKTIDVRQRRRAAWLQPCLALTAHVEASRGHTQS